MQNTNQGPFSSESNYVSCPEAPHVKITNLSFRSFYIIEDRLFFLNTFINSTQKSMMTVYPSVIDVPCPYSIFFFFSLCATANFFFQVILLVKWHVHLFQTFQWKSWRNTFSGFAYLFSGCSQVWSCYRLRKERLLIWATWWTRCCLYFFFPLATDTVSDFLLNPSVLCFLVLPEKRKNWHPHKMLFILP